PEPPATVGLGDVIYVAQWTPNQYTVIYDGNGATGGATASTLHTYDGYKVLAFNGFTRTGHNFVNWNTEPDGSGTAYEAAQSVLNLATEGTVTLYAQWSVSTYQVLMAPNGGSGNIKMQGIKYGQSANLQPNTFTRAGYTFAGWNTAADGSGTPYADGAMYGPMQFPNEWLYAQWSPNSYQITFDANGGEGGTSGYLPCGSALDPPVVTKPGYQFAGWLPEPPATVPAEDAVYVAQWVEYREVTVVFNLNGGTGTVPAAQVGLP
ncbi:MAG TPA: InlB B-repeat-containing protein, partial [Clostridiales bacterium]|nr:InlB B-repeat-containing protein [Clostridiales bacterium]